MSAPLFVEIRCEELPARFVEPAAAELARNLSRLLKGIDQGAIRTWATPRRLAVEIAQVAPGRPVEEQLVTGPPEAAAFRDGKPTKAAEGFARGRGVAVDALEIVETPKGRVIAARIQSGGERTMDLVAAGIEEAILSMVFPKPMRWGEGAVRWARPIHGLVCFYGAERIEASVAGIQSGSQTWGHRLAEGPLALNGSAAQWEAGLRAAWVEPDVAARRARIEAELARVAKSIDCELLGAEELLDEVTHLVEWPVVIPAAFDPSLLELPSRLLIEAMRIHQRVFPLVSGGRLTHRFLVVTNQPHATDPAVAEKIAQGTKNVLAARFDDARYFFAEDKKKGLAEHGARLSGMQWIRNGGTMEQKQARVSTLALALADLVGADPDEARLAGSLCKADLATQMVGEFPELQGHVGHLLALHEEIEVTVAMAIEEHYLPRFTGDQGPRSAAGRAVALADRLDTLTGCFLLGLKPKGGADPLGLRRAANGVVQILLEAGVRIALPQLLAVALRDSDPPEGTDARNLLFEEIISFILSRFRASAAEEHGTEVVEAVLATGDTDLVALDSRMGALAALAQSPEFGPMKLTFKRVLNITKDHPSTFYSPGALAEPAEHALHLALLSARELAHQCGASLDHAGALDALSALKAPVDRLFDEVLVMAEDPEVRRHRLGLLAAVAAEFKEVADFRLLSTDFN